MPAARRADTGPRKRLLLFICGASESGKTVLARQLSAAAKQPRLVLDPSASWGDEGLWVAKPWDAVARVLREGFSGTVIFDDGDRYLPKRGHQETWGTLWTSHRHLGVDGLVITRRVQELPELAWSSADRLFVFRTMPGSAAEEYLYSRGYVPRDVELPRQPLEYLDVDLFGESVVRRRITPAELKRYGNPRGH